MDETIQSIYDATEIADDIPLDTSLRPSKLDHYHGQIDLKQNIRVLLESTQKRGAPLDHILLYGPPGLGKTTLARIIAQELGVNLRTTSGPALERAGDLASILTNLEDRDLLFIDEVHRLPKAVEETLYPAMEDYALDLVIGRGPAARTLRLDLPKFTIVGATTRIGLMSAPMRDRFGGIFRLDYYTDTELTDIVEQSARLLELNLSIDAALAIATRSRGTPRIANRLLKRVRDVAVVSEIELIDMTTVIETCRMLAIDDDGLTKLDLQYLKALVHKFNGGPVGVETISAALSEDIGSIEDVIEPFLIQKGFLNKTNRGRVATENAHQKVTITN